jgi:hypothetical protein
VPPWPPRRDGGQARAREFLARFVIAEPHAEILIALTGQLSVSVVQAFVQANQHADPATRQEVFAGLLREIEATALEAE